MSAADYPYFAPPPIGLAHRGGAANPANVGIENTLAAFRTAVELGFRYLETDVHATRDGRLVAFHDEHLDRVTDRVGAIADLPWREVAAARIGGREPIPTVDELLDAFPDARINIDIKAPGAVDPLWETIRAHAAYERVCGVVLGEAAAGVPAAGRGAGGHRGRPSGDGGVALPAGAGVGAGALPGQVLQIPTTHEVRGRTLALVTPGLVAAAHRFGMQVHVWTIDARDEMERLLDLGVDGIVSDRIDVLRDVLAARGAWPT